MHNNNGGYAGGAGGEVEQVEQVDQALGLGHHKKESIASIYKVAYST